NYDFEWTVPIQNLNQTPSQLSLYVINRFEDAQYLDKTWHRFC
ncbi:MAG: hypothetical protein ACI9YO_003189, partial [Gammaproteobacteria bacterium]